MRRLALLAVSAVSCMPAALPARGPITSTAVTATAANPLGGEPITYTVRRWDDSTCDPPFEDSTAKVSATGGEICLTTIDIEVTRDDGSTPSAAEPGYSFYFVSETARTADFRVLRAVPTIQVSVCESPEELEPRERRQFVWRTEWTGCVSNGGVLTATTTELQQWTRPDSTPDMPIQQYRWHVEQLAAP